MQNKIKTNNKIKIMVKPSSIKGFNYDYYFIGLHSVLITHDIQVYYRLLGVIKNIEIIKEV